MSRSADSSFVLTEPRTHPYTEVADSIRSTGWQEIATAVNTLYEQARGTLVADYHPTGLLTTTTGDARYRVYLPGEVGDGTLSLRVYVYYTTGVSASGTVRVATVNAGASSTAAVTSSSAGWITATVDADASNEYEEIVVDWSAATNAPVILGVSAFALRTRTALADAADDFAYAADGFVPLELEEYGGDEPLTATKARIVHDNLRLIWERGGQAIATSYVDSPIADATVYADLALPQHIREGQTATLRVWVNYTWTGSGAGVDFGNFAVAAGNSSSLGITSSGGTATWYAARDLTIDLPSDASQYPDSVRFSLSCSGDIEINQISAYWRDLTYG